MYRSISLFFFKVGLCRFQIRYWKVMEKGLVLINVHKEELLNYAGSSHANTFACGLFPVNCILSSDNLKLENTVVS